MKSKQSHEGYLMIDHRNSPGIPQELIDKLAKEGKEIPHAQAGGMLEAATLTCSHCQQVFLKNPERHRPRGYCAKCDHYICDNPGCNAQCIPMKKIIDEAQEAAFLQEQRTGIILTP